MEYCIVCGDRFNERRKGEFACSATCLSIFHEEAPCASCEESNLCPHAFDPYNPNADCFADDQPKTQSSGGRQCPDCP